MAINLIDAVTDNLKGPVLEQLGAWIGENPERTRELAGTIVPAILSGLSEKLGEPEGRSLLGSTLDQVDDGMLDKLGALSKDSEAEKVATSGGGLLDSLLGEQLLTAVIGGIAGAIGVEAGKVKALIGFLTPVVLGALKRLMTRQGLSLTWLIGMFAQQKGTIASALPKAWSEVLTTAASVVAGVEASGDVPDSEAVTASDDVSDSEDTEAAIPQAG